MKLTCNINNSLYVINVDSDKPLSKILEDTVESFAVNSRCRGANCGNCFALVNGICMLTCLVPAFKANNATILTYEGFSKTRFCNDIERAYSECGTKPCAQCYNSKTLLISSIVEKIEQRDKLYKFNNDVVTLSFIANELSLCSCKCMEVSKIAKIIKLIRHFRSEHNGKD